MKAWLRGFGAVGTGTMAIDGTADKKFEMVKVIW